jgi:hypothetical protein
MKPGDIVRFRDDHKDKRSLAILIEYQKWEKVASVLFEGRLIRVRAEHIEKAGKADGV